jgi:hypothetical protein
MVSLNLSELGPRAVESRRALTYTKTVATQKLKGLGEIVETVSTSLPIEQSTQWNLGTLERRRGPVELPNKNWVSPTVDLAEAEILSSEILPCS